MTSESRPAAVGFHSGELAVQTRAGVRSRAERLASTAARGELRAPTVDFVAARRHILHGHHPSDVGQRRLPPRRAGGFVHVEHDRLWWPDYLDNNLFNSLGNLTVDPATALLFIDFPTGTALQLSGTAKMVWTDLKPQDEHHSGRQVTFTPEHVVVTGIPGLGAEC
jgi:predicted pyridoxine 5'-phosphate oxidase superfamily flavin-nucleotide-binding protein